MNHASRRSVPRLAMSPLIYLLCIICAIASCVLITSGRADESAKSLTVPATGVSSSSGDSNPQMSAMPYGMDDTPQPTLPGGKLPQYQLESQRRVAETSAQIEDRTLRFLLALPAEPVLVEARITIDGEAFRKKREQRVRETLQAALQPPAEIEPEVVPLRAEKPAIATAEGEVEEEAETETEELVSSIPAYESAASHIEKLRRYISFIGREPSLDEVRWFFIDRLDGPTLLLLKDSFQAFRADQAPIFHILDRNRDGALSSAEIGQAMESFLDCDLNRNEVVDYLEINEAANDPRLRSANLTSTSALLYLLPTEESASETYYDLLSRYDTPQAQATSLPARFDADSNGLWDAEELEHLRTMPADITIEVSFDSTARSNSALSVSEESLRRLKAQQLTAEIVNTSIVLHLPDCELWLSAIQLQAGDQISIGTVIDGYPMLPMLDPNDDGRFTIRELRSVTAAIRKFDVDGDGQILKAELRPAIRLSFGLGSSVHQDLAGVRTIHPPGSPSVAGPAWFARMDGNKDNDLSRSEFPGTDEQFAQLDTDTDKLVSAEEALEFDRKSNPPKPEQSTDETKSETTTEEPAKNDDNETPPGVIE